MDRGLNLVTLAGTDFTTAFFFPAPKTGMSVADRYRLKHMAQRHKGASAATGF